MKGKKLKLPGKAAIALIIGGDLLLLLIGWFMLIGPQRATAASIAQATAATEAQIVVAKAPVVPQTPAAAIQQPVIKTADLYSLAKALPTTVDQPDLLLELDQVARDAGIELTNLSFGAVTPATTGGYSTVGINLSFNGDFYSITDLLYRLRSLVSVRNGQLQTAGRLFSVGTVGLAPLSGTGLSASLTVTAYVYGSGDPAADAAAAAAAAAPPAVPAATSTDTTQTATTPASSSDVAPGP